MNTPLSVYNSPHVFHGNAKSVSKRFRRPSPGGEQIAHSLNPCIWESGAPIPLPLRLPPFGISVRHILGVCPYEQVGRVAADWIIAFVANMRPGLEGDAGEQKRPPMRPHNFSAVVECPVSLPRSSASPRPTGIRPAALINVSPKKNFWRSDWLKFCMMPGQESHRSALNKSTGAIIVGAKICLSSAATLAIAGLDMFVHALDCSTFYNQTLWGRG